MNDRASNSEPSSRVVFAGTGSALPSRVVGNEEFVSILETSDEWIHQRTGIRTRRFCDSHQSSATLAVQASRNALTAAGLDASEIDLIICATVTPERNTPPNAAIVQAELGCRMVAAFDMAAACSGFLYAVGVARGMMLAGMARHALVVGAESLGRSLDFQDRNSCILFGDGAGAVVLSVEESSTRGIQYLTLAADGSRGDLIQVPGAMTWTNGMATATPKPSSFIQLAGPETFRFAVKTLTRLLLEIQDDCQISLDEIACIVPHQVNLRVFEAVADQLKFSMDKLVVNIDRYGNTTAASIPIALDEAVRNGRISKGDLIAIVAFGGGLTWSSALVRW